MLDVQIDYDTADRIIVCTLKDSMNSLKREIKNLRSKKNLLPHQKGDLEYYIKDLNAMKIVYEYYGGNCK
jgi:hypothetical protein